jgi:hypothetical protein
MLSTNELCFNNMNMLIEAEEQWGNFCKGIIVLEHQAIISEDSSFLMEEASNWEKFKNFFKNLYKRICNFITSVQAKWSDLTASIRSKLSPKKSKYLEKAKNKKTYKNSFKDAHIDSIIIAKNIVKNKAVILAKLLSATPDEFEEAIGAKKIKDSMIYSLPSKAVDAVNYFYDFLENDRKAAGDFLRDAKSKLDDSYKMAIKICDKGSYDEAQQMKEEMFAFDKNINKMVIYINKGTSCAISMIKQIVKND